MKLVGEHIEEFEPASFEEVEIALIKSDQSGEYTYFVLDDIDGSFIQAARHGGGYVVEKKKLIGREMYRAFIPKRSKGAGTSFFYFNSTKHVMINDEILTLSEVITLFKVFYEGKSYPKGVSWRFLMSTPQ